MKKRSAKHSLLDRNILHGHQLRDLFLFGKTGISTIRSYLHELIHSLEVMLFRSYAISSYFNEVLLNQTKRHFRLMLKYAAYITFVLFLETTVRIPDSRINDIKYSFILIIPIICAYLSTLFPLKHNTYVFMSSILCICFPIIILWSRRIAFRADHGLLTPIIILIICKSVEARNQCKSALKHQVHWIEAIMPSCIREEYQLFRNRKLYPNKDMWVFNKTYQNVSILFADIVGFTNMSSNKTALQVVTMLNNLFNRFDDLCLLTKCEKIGTLGDCYYCVSGCPIPQYDHAKCCIEMGLGMCRIIKVFNYDYNESVSMRVGIHTGRVNAAIIGIKRFRFDVYSYDVIIASELESTGRAGRVHVSQITFDLTKNIYNFSKGEPLIIKKEEQCGIAGMQLTKTTMDTYYVDPRSSLLHEKHE
ncbi:unnamed protein product, partial [Trichobilharzia szidati]